MLLVAVLVAAALSDTLSPLIAPKTPTKSLPKTLPKTPTKTSPKTPTKTLPKTPTKTPPKTPLGQSYTIFVQTADQITILLQSEITSKVPRDKLPSFQMDVYNATFSQTSTGTLGDFLDNKNALDNRASPSFGDVTLIHNRTHRYCWKFLPCSSLIPHFKSKCRTIPSNATEINVVRSDLPVIFLLEVPHYTQTNYTYTQTNYTSRLCTCSSVDVSGCSVGASSSIDHLLITITATPACSTYLISLDNTTCLVTVWDVSEVVTLDYSDSRFALDVASSRSTSYLLVFDTPEQERLKVSCTKHGPAGSKKAYCPKQGETKGFASSDPVQLTLPKLDKDELYWVQYSNTTLYGRQDEKITTTINVIDLRYLVDVCSTIARDGRCRYYDDVNIVTCPGHYTLNYSYTVLCQPSLQFTGHFGSYSQLTQSSPNRSGSSTGLIAGIILLCVSLAAVGGWAVAKLPFCKNKGGAEALYTEPDEMSEPEQYSQSSAVEIIHPGQYC